MLEIKYIRENREDVINRMRKRNIDITEQVDEILRLDKKLRQLKQEIDELKRLKKNENYYVGALIGEINCLQNSGESCGCSNRPAHAHRSVSLGANRSPKPR